MNDKANTKQAPNKPGSDNRGKGRGRHGGRRRPQRRQREPREFEQKLLELDRVTRVTSGGKRMRFRAALVIGDGKGKVGFGLSKGADVAMAIEKAYRQAKKNIVKVELADETFPHEVFVKKGAAKVLLKPAPKGTGLKAGGAVRVILEMAGVPNASCKNLGTNNKVSIARATMAGLQQLRTKKS